MASAAPCSTSAVQSQPWSDFPQAVASGLPFGCSGQPSSSQLSMIAAFVRSPQVACRTQQTSRSTAPLASQCGPAQYCKPTPGFAMYPSPQSSSVIASAPSASGPFLSPHVASDRQQVSRSTTVLLNVCDLQMHQERMVAEGGRKDEEKQVRIL